MRVKYKMRGIFRTIAMLVIAIGYVSDMFGYATDSDGYHYLSDPQVEIDGIRYSLVYYNYPTNYNLCDDYDGRFLLQNEWKIQLEQTSNLCHFDYQNNKFQLRDGSEIPAFIYYAKVLESNAPNVEAGYPRYDASKDKMTQRHPYYRGEVWLQDSVLLPALPNLREKRYVYVCDICQFNKELTFIRTPKYCTFARNKFQYCPNLKAVQIGASQCVCDKSFSGCPNLETVIFEKDPLVGQAFTDCHNIKKVVLEGSCLPDTYGEVFEDNVYEDATLYVREELIQSARKHPLWSKFNRIRDIDEYVSGVETINPDTAVRYEVYNLSGACVRSAISGENWREGLPSGVYIVKSSLGSVKKEYIK